MKIRILSHKNLFKDHENNYEKRLVIIICDTGKTIYGLSGDTVGKIYGEKIITFDDIDSDMLKHETYKKDVLSGKLTLFTTEKSKEIFNFIETFRKEIYTNEINEIIVSCVGGKCRSSAVAKAIGKTFGFDVDFIDTTVELPEDCSWMNHEQKLEKKYIQNELVFNTMMKISNQYEYINEPQLKEYEYIKK